MQASSRRPVDGFFPSCVLRYASRHASSQSQLSLRFWYENTLELASKGLSPALLGREDPFQALELWNNGRVIGRVFGTFVVKVERLH